MGVTLSLFTSTSNILTCKIFNIFLIYFPDLWIWEPCFFFKIISEGSLCHVFYLSIYISYYISIYLFLFIYVSFYPSVMFSNLKRQEQMICVKSWIWFKFIYLSCYLYLSLSIYLPILSTNYISYNHTIYLSYFLTYYQSYSLTYYPFFDCFVTFVAL